MLNIEGTTMDSLKLLRAVIDQEVKILPDQAPLEYFVHHNNLHHYEDIKFEDAVEKSFINYGKSPYMPLTYYRVKLNEGQIRESELKEAFKDNGLTLTNDQFAFISEKLYEMNDTEQIQFYRSENMIFDSKKSKWRKMEQRELLIWNELEGLTCETPQVLYPDYHVNRSVNTTSTTIIPFLMGLMDQGQAEFQLSNHQRKSVWTTFLSYVGTVANKQRLANYIDSIPVSSEEVENHLVQKLKKFNTDEVLEVVRTELNALPGWAGMIYKLSHNKEVIPRKDVHLRLEDYLLMRLILNDLLDIESKTDYRPLYTDLLVKDNVLSFLCQGSDSVKSAYEIYHLFIKITPLVLRRVFQQAFEKSYQNKILSGFKGKSIKEIPTPKYQMFFCIDDREASFRRYLEEVSQGNIATYGVAGFFGLDMMYQKVGEKYPRRLCPPAAQPKYLVKEEGASSKFKFARYYHFEHSSFIRSATAGILMAPWRTLQFKLHLYAPRLRGQLIQKLKFTKLKQINYKNYYTNQESIPETLKLGYTIEEQAQRVAAILRGSGLVKDFAPFIFMIGHGHDSFNNPHVAAYRCGACSGANAYPNAKVFAKAANDPEVRVTLSKNFNINIPDTTYFVGAYHDTCNDDVQLYDTDSNFLCDQEKVKILALLQRARELNAKERCRKFYQAPRNLSPANALKFVEERAWRLAEPRPELNHATNSLCIVGRRKLTESLFLDRRAFLVSYDASIDQDSSILGALLGAVIPVCAGINLEYYFSKVDTENFGSGSKTSHNVVGLYGVMNGIRGDLRTGLVWQMVEYHDPLRILFVVEALPEQIELIMQQNKHVKNLIANRWISLALINPMDSTDIKLFEKNEFRDANLAEFNIPEFENSMNVPTGIEKPVDIAYLRGK